MGQPRRRFPGGSVGSYFVVMPVHDGISEGSCCLTEKEALKAAQELANLRQRTVYITKYVNHCSPEEPDA